MKGIFLDFLTNKCNNGKYVNDDNYLIVLLIMF